MRSLVTAILATGVLALAPISAGAAPCPRASLPDLEDEVMCTVCGTTLGLATEAPQAERERAFILERIERCESKDEIKAALAAEFGSEVLAVPEEEGFGLAAYAVPIVVLLGGALAVAVTTLRWRHARQRAGTETAAAGGEPGSGRYARLEADLERYDL